MSSILSLGFIGMGKTGRIRHEESIRFPNTQAVGYVDPNPAIGEIAISRFSTAEELANDAKPDAVFISTPNKFTAPLTRFFLERGIAVFAEKPPARSTEELLSVSALVHEPACPTLMYGFNHRHTAGVKSLVNRVRNQDVGEVLWLRGRYGKEIDDRFYSDWRSNYSLSGGGILLDQGIHMVDLMREITGGFDQASSAITNYVTQLEGIEDNAFVIFRSNQTGITASVHSTMTQWRYLFSLEVFCRDGSLILNGLRTPSGNYGSEVLTVHSRNSQGVQYTEEVTFEADEQTSWAAEIGIFLDSVRNGKQPASGNINDAIETLTLIEMAYKADPSFYRPSADHSDYSSPVSLHPSSN